MHQVTVLALDGVYPFELGIPRRIFGALPEHYAVRTCTLDGRPVRTDADFTIGVEHGPEALETADTVVIPPFDLTLVTGGLPEPVAAVLARIRPGTRIVSICTGAFLLAATGVLDGRPATTHWCQSALFREMFPAVRLDQDVLFVDDGDVLTSAGAASGVDVCLHVVRRDLGSRIANGVARRCVVPPMRDGGQAQFVDQPVPDPAMTSTAATRQWALERLHLPLTQSDLAGHARMSLRTFARRFRDEVGVSPGRWLIQQRVARARELLEASDLSVEQIAGQVGFVTGTSLRQHLREALGVSPVAYRRTFRTEMV
ncbi:GlxA family transcriptional regulator [Allokutzneria albata]|uniref:Transcriptional regulator GlxA family, contains an amidase domain and an AraC-type DNA-binding HTH domain n=1 Tax=Allokutzneria albata TaxID=211114 RepID=A0A1G9TTV9_ALLAB|nr:helix-turn-helix domain-containing protein [Allokutzneria albata]SDM50998.1 Transcriptional regulator GlxA family, contains an amidase domain and an AraC-type DNA-binding HTH domain [Allokutzneria albata]